MRPSLSLTCHGPKADCWCSGLFLERLSRCWGGQLFTAYASASIPALPPRTQGNLLEEQIQSLCGKWQHGRGTKSTSQITIRLKSQPTRPSQHWLIINENYPDCSSQVSGLLFSRRGEKCFFEEFTEHQRQCHSLSRRGKSSFEIMS